MFDVFDPLPQAELRPAVQTLEEMNRHFADVAAAALHEQLEADLVADRIDVARRQDPAAPDGEEAARRVADLDAERARQQPRAEAVEAPRQRPARIRRAARDE